MGGIYIVSCLKAGVQTWVCIPTDKVPGTSLPLS